MKNFKKVFAIIFTVLTVVFGVLVTVQERQIFTYVSQIGSTYDFDRAVGIASLIVLVSDIFLLVVSVLSLILVIFNKLSPYKAIVGCAIAVLIKYLIAIFSELIAMLLIGATGEKYKEYFFGPESLAIVPSLMFIIALVLLIISTANQYENTFKRAIMSIVGAALAVSGISFYYISRIAIDPKVDWLKIFGLVVAIGLQGAIIIYSTLPQTRGYKKIKEETEQQPNN